jgi:hypothetical protein
LLCDLPLWPGMTMASLYTFSVVGPAATSTALTDPVSFNVAAHSVKAGGSTCHIDPLAVCGFGN